MRSRNVEEDMAEDLWHLGVDGQLLAEKILTIIIIFYYKVKMPIILNVLIAHLNFHYFTGIRKPHFE